MEIAKIQGTNTKKKLHKQKYRKILCEREKWNCTQSPRTKTQMLRDLK